MRKILFLSVLAIGLTACGGRNNNQPIEAAPKILGPVFCGADDVMPKGPQLPGL